MYGKLKPGDKISELTLKSIHGTSITLPDKETRFTHLQFRRFAGCPICNLHLRSFMKSNEQIKAAGIHEVVFFHSTIEQMLPYQGDLPFDVIADPEKKLYKAFGVESSLRAVLDPRAWLAALRGTWAARSANAAVGAEQGHLGLPADLLLDASGKVLASKYGQHADDQWTLAELLEFVS